MVGSSSTKTAELSVLIARGLLSKRRGASRLLLKALSATNTHVLVFIVDVYLVVVTIFNIFVMGVISPGRCRDPPLL
jgi:hypothetical protein